MTLVRPKLGVGQKTLIAFSIVFWLPVSVMAAMLFFLTQTQLHNDAISHIKVQLKAAGEVYAERTHQLKGVLNQLSQQQQTQRLFAEKDSQGLREILQGISKENDFVTIVLAVDENRQVIGQRNRVSSDILNINNVLTDALTTGAMTHSTELVSREFLGSENSELKKLFKDVGLVQFVVAPVRLSGKVHGALVVGVLLSDDPWLGNTIYNRFGVQMTLFAGSPSELSFLHSTSSVPHNAWQLWQPLPVLLQEQISHGKPFYGQLPISGIDTTVAFEPLKDSRNRVVGAMGISTESRSINNIALSLIGKAGLVAALLGLLVSIALTLIIHHDITRPLNSLVGAMQRFGKGDLDTEIDLRTGDQLEALGDGFNTMARVICQREERLKKHNRITKLLMSTLDIDELLNQTLKAVLEVTRYHSGGNYLKEKHSKILVIHAYVGTRDDLPSMKVGEGLPGQVAKTGECLIISTSEYMAGEMLEMGYARSAPREMAYIPLVYQERVLGVLMIGCMEIYGESERQLFDYLADQISVALDNAMMHRRIHEMSVTDGLTGLYNRRMLNIRLAEEWAASTRHERPMSILLADADDFKSINDEYGHDKGDQVLQMFAEIFRSNTRKEDLVARYGGEEFVAVLPDTEIADAKVLAERVREVASNHIFSWKGGAVTLSIGVATYPNLEVETGEELIQLADKAMYEAKARGKNKVAVADRKWVKKVS